MIVSLALVSVTIIFLRDGVVSPMPNPPLLPGLGTGWIYPGELKLSFLCTIDGRTLGIQKIGFCEEESVSSKGGSIQFIAPRTTESLKFN